jgi:hypothetical protein
MVFPIILDNYGDTLVFADLASATRYLEPIDVSNGEYIGYDAEGYQLNIEVDDQSRISIFKDENAPNHSDQLRNILSRFLKATRTPEEWILSASLQELGKKAETFAIT